LQLGQGYPVPWRPSLPQRRRSDLPGSPGHPASPLLTHPTMTPHDLGLLVVLLLPGMLLSVLLLSTFAAGG
jgi:hypothetical protein